MLITCGITTFAFKYRPNEGNNIFLNLVSVVLYSSFDLKEKGWQAQKVGVPHWRWLFVREGLGFFFKALLLLLTGQNYVCFNHWRSITLHTLSYPASERSGCLRVSTLAHEQYKHQCFETSYFIQERRICFAGSSVLVHFCLTCS